MAIAFLVGRIIVALFYINSALNHFRNLNKMAGYAGSKGVPAPKLVIAGTGVLLMVGGLSLGLAYYPIVGIAAVCLFLAGVTPVMHNFWGIPDPQHRMSEMINFTKNLGLLGSTLMFLAIPQPWPYSLGH